MTKVLIVDDSVILRRGIVLILKEHYGDEVVFHEIESEAIALQEALRNAYDLVLLNISECIDGLNLLQRLRREKNCPSILILASRQEELNLMHSFRTGADGYLSKKSTPEELVTAVDKLLSGGKYISSIFTEMMISYVKDAKSTTYPHEALSAREISVFLGIASGRGTKDIADQFCLSVKTIGTYRARIFQKMGMKNNADIITYAIRYKLVE